MRQCIKTKYMPPTNHKGARIAAYWDGGRKEYPYDYGLNASDNHTAAAAQLAAHLGWTLSGKYGWHDSCAYHLLEG